MMKVSGGSHSNVKDENQNWVRSKEACIAKVMLQEVFAQDIATVIIVTGHVTLLALMPLDPFAELHILECLLYAIEPLIHYLYVTPPKFTTTNWLHCVTCLILADTKHVKRDTFSHIVVVEGNCLTYWIFAHWADKTTYLSTTVIYNFITQKWDHQHFCFLPVIFITISTPNKKKSFLKKLSLVKQIKETNGVICNIYDRQMLMISICKEILKSMSNIPIKK